MGKTENLVTFWTKSGDFLMSEVKSSDENLQIRSYIGKSMGFCTRRRFSQLFYLYIVIFIQVFNFYINVSSVDTFPLICKLILVYKRLLTNFLTLLWHQKRRRDKRIAIDSLSACQFLSISSSLSHVVLSLALSFALSLSLALYPFALSLPRTFSFRSVFHRSLSLRFLSLRSLSHSLSLSLSLKDHGSSALHT